MCDGVGVGVGVEVRGVVECAVGGTDEVGVALGGPGMNRASNTAKGKTWTLSHKAAFGLCWFSWTRTVIFAARPSPDLSSLATSSRTLSPWTPFLPFAYDYWTLIQNAIFSLCPFS